MNSPVAWVLVFHILGFVFWTAGLLVATQVLATHTQEKSDEVRRVLSRLETKLLKGVAHPGAAITVVAGVAVVVVRPAYLNQGWLHPKLFLVANLIALELIGHVRAMALQAGCLWL